MSLDFMLIERPYPRMASSSCGAALPPEIVFCQNITHNLATMAGEAGIYKVLWRPSENNFHLASDALPVLEDGLKLMTDNPSHFRGFNPPNNWGNYNSFITDVTKICDACKNNPHTTLMSCT